MWTAARDAHGSRWSSTAAALELAPSRHSLGTGARGTPPAAPDKIAGERSSVAGAVCLVSCRRAHSVVVTRRVRDHVGVMCSNVCPCRTALCPPTATMAAARVHPEQLSSMSEGPSQLAAAIKRGDAARALALLEGMGAPALLQAVEFPWGGPFSRCPKGCSGNLQNDDRSVKLDIPVPSPLPTWLSTFLSVSPTLCDGHSIPAVRVSMLALISGLFWCARWRTVMSPTWTCTWSPGSLWTAL